MAEKQTQFSLFGAVMMNVNLMVGAAAFIGPAMMTQYAHSASFYGWIWAALLFFPVVWSIAQVTTLFPGKGSFYSYASHGISENAGFISGWIYFLGYVSMGSLQLMSLNELMVRMTGSTGLMNNMFIVNILFLALLVVLTFLPVGTIDKIQSSGTLFKLTPLMIVLVSIPLYFNLDKVPAITQVSPAVLLPTIPMAIFGFWGFEGVCSVSHLIKDGKTNTARSIFIGFGTAVTIYFLFHLGLLCLMGPKALQLEGVQAFVNYMGAGSVAQYLGVLVRSAIIVAYINAIFGGMIANGAMLCAMAEDKMVFLSNKLSGRTGSGRPLSAVLAHTACMFFFVSCIPNKEILNAMSNLGLLGAFFLTIISLFFLHRKKANLVGQLTSIIGLGSCALLGYYSWQIAGTTPIARLAATGPFLAIIIGGFLLFTQTREKAA